MFGNTDDLQDKLFDARKEIVAQRREIIALLRQLGAELTNGGKQEDFPRWIRDRLRELGEDI